MEYGVWLLMSRLQCIEVNDLYLNYRYRVCSEINFTEAHVAFDSFCVLGF